MILDLTAYSPASLQEAFSGFTTEAADGTVKADEEGIVVVTPEPTNGAGALLTWNYVGTEGWSDDQRFVTDLLDEVEATVCIDRSRVFLTGFAVGGVFASITACEQADRFAGLATVAGLFAPEGCEPTKPLPVVSFHGTGDRFIPFDGGIGSGPAGLGLSSETVEGLTFMATRPGALASSEAWARHDGCDPGPATDDAGDGVTRRTWTGCEDDVAVELYAIDGGEHTWPGSTGMDGYAELLGPVSDQIDATDVIWDFFEARAP
jgi:polyhydroxybutyrate depolymerase